MISSAQYTLTPGTLQLLVGDTVASEEIHIHCSAGSFFVGGSDVTVSNGLKIDNGDKITILNHLGALYAVCSTGTPTLSMLVIEK